MTDWNPVDYLKFRNERMQPACDLISRIDHPGPESIIDIGCGPGHCTKLLSDRWKNAHIMGIDNSPAMIETARKDYPGNEWQLIDAATEEIAGHYDIVFSNAAIQWIPDHESFLQKLHRLLNNEGVLAIQIPLFWEMPLGIKIAALSWSDRWAAKTGKISEHFTIHSAFYYFDHLYTHFTSINIWITDYIHIMPSHGSIIEMIRSTGLKPYLDRLETDAEKTEFENMVEERIETEYPRQQNGSVLFPFKRLFFTARKK